MPTPASVRPTARMPACLVPTATSWSRSASATRWYSACTNGSAWQVRISAADSRSVARPASIQTRRVSVTVRLMLRVLQPRGPQHRPSLGQHGDHQDGQQHGVQRAEADRGRRQRECGTDQLDQILGDPLDVVEPPVAGPVQPVVEGVVVERGQVDPQARGVEPSSATRRTAGTTRAWASDTPASRAPRSMYAAPTSSSPGTAAASRAGVGPSANSPSSATVVASSPNAVSTPEPSCITTMAIAARGAAAATAPNTGRVPDRIRRGSCRTPPA